MSQLTKSPFAGQPKLLAVVKQQIEVDNFVEQVFNKRKSVENGVIVARKLHELFINRAHYLKDLIDEVYGDKLPTGAGVGLVCFPDRLTFEFTISAQGAGFTLRSTLHGFSDIEAYLLERLK